MKFWQDLKRADEVMTTENRSYRRSIYPLLWFSGICEGIYILAGAFDLISILIFATREKMATAALCWVICFVLGLVLCIFVTQFGSPTGDNGGIIRLAMGILLGVAGVLYVGYRWLMHGGSNLPPIMPLFVIEFGLWYQHISWFTIIHFLAAVGWLSCGLLLMALKVIYWRYSSNQSPS